MPIPFVLDPFQKAALDWIYQDHSVLISAPTGSGKTVVAEAAIEQALRNGEHAIYTAPIKALSNQKFRDFRERFGEEQVGILTGDVSIQPEAPIVIMTTEIYRNCLFDHSKRLEKLGWVIFDEIHYLDDPERGTVWEEALLFTPERVRILALSATIPNIEQLAEWIRQIHNRPIEVIMESKRPVPLHINYQCQGQFFDKPQTLFRHGYFGRDSWRISPRERRRGLHAPKAKPNRLDQLLVHLQEKDRLPLIYFAFGRRRTEELAGEASPYSFLNSEERVMIADKFQALLEKYDLTAENSALVMRPLIEQGIAYHHAGMLPTLKEIIEQLFTSRLIKVIFTTETFALGINMPARTVVLDELEKYSGAGFRQLTTRDFYQMAGRAGRRGLDPEGFVYVRINPHSISYSDAQKIIFGKPEGVESQLNTTYATLLNLYRDLGENLISIYPRTFHHFQFQAREHRLAVSQIEQRIRLLKELRYIEHNKLTPKGEFASAVFGYELLLSEMHEDGYLDHLDPYRLVVLLAALIYEPRKGARIPRLSRPHLKLEEEVRAYSKKIYKIENRFRIQPYTRLCHFHLSPAVEAWAYKIPFDELMEYTDTDEGEIVRYLRMVIQLLRELIQNPYSPPPLKEAAKTARMLINRDVVDAEKQLRN